VKADLPETVVLSIEPGREIFVDAGEFITKVVRIRQRDSQPVQSVFVDGSFVFMPSATMRARKHRTAFFDADFNAIEELNGYCVLGGCAALSSDYLFKGVVKSPRKVKKDSYVVVKDIGAYGASQHLEFLNKRPAAEVLVRKSGSIEVITQRGDFTDRVRHILPVPEPLEVTQGTMLSAAGS